MYPWILTKCYLSLACTLLLLTQFSTLDNCVRPNYTICTPPDTPSIAVGNEVLQLFIFLISLQKALRLRYGRLFANASLRNMFSLFLINRRAYLNRGLHFTLRSYTGPCLGLPAIIYICLISLEVSYKLSTYTAFCIICSLGCISELTISLYSSSLIASI